MPLFLDLQAIANIGGGMIIDARNFTNLELQSLAVVASKKCRYGVRVMRNPYALKSKVFYLSP